MNITITARKFKARETLKDYIKDEVKSLLKYDDSIISAGVILSFQNSHDSIKKAEITLHIPGQTLVATEQTEEFTKSITLAANKLSSQLKTLKSKRKSRAK
ncbi:MAG: ribosome-associated translation inhibitor RaiA [Ignavibacteriaceae bacterium]|nr:ribosome-associated translation inhibitor RaiA [Ignavibacteriaceae bacterium]